MIPNTLQLLIFTYWYTLLHINSIYKNIYRYIILI